MFAHMCRGNFPGCHVVGLTV